MCLQTMTQAGRGHATQLISLVHADELCIAPRKQTELVTEKDKSGGHLFKYRQIHTLQHTNVYSKILKIWLAATHFCLIILCCSFFHKSLNSLQNTDHGLKKSFGLTSNSPVLGLNTKYAQHTWNCFLASSKFISCSLRSTCPVKLMLWIT